MPKTNSERNNTTLSSVCVSVFAWDKSVKHIYDAGDSEIKFYYMDPLGPQNKDLLFYTT